MKKKLLLSLLLLFIGVSSGNANTIIASMADETYKWFEPSGSIALATNATYRDASAMAANEENYTIGVVGSHRTSVTLNPVTLVKTQEVNIVVQPQISTTLCVGEPLVLVVVATGTNLTYQWFKGTTALVGQVTPTLYITTITTANAGIYSVKITSSNDVITSVNAVLNVNESPMIVTQPQGTTVCEGEPINLIVTATGTFLTYQWFKGSTVIPGATGSVYSIISAMVADSGTYTCVITNSCGSITSTNSVVEVSNGLGSGATPCGDAIQLISFIDSNNNGVKENSESTFTYGSFTYQKNNIGNIYYINNPMGVQNIYDSITTNTYDFNYQIDSGFAAYYALTPTSFNDLNIPFGSGVQTLYFPITVTQTYSDVDVSIIPIGVPRPGFPFTHKIIYRNLGVLPASGVVTYTKDNANITITAVNPAASSSNSNGFTRDYSNLLPGETRSIFVTMLVATIPTVNLGDVISNTVSITSAANDLNVMNNSFTTSQVVVGSYDPNDKNEARGANVQIGQFSQDDYLFYTIRFQNSGTAAAETVRIEDTLNSQYNFASVQMISASHDYTMVRINNKLIWTFNDINLPAEIINEPGSHGYVTFKIKLNPGFVVGAIIPNTAEIYFDFNPPIITNTFQTTFVPNLGVGTFDVNNLMVYPNPAREIVNVQLKNSTETLQKITIYDMVGKTILSLSANNTQQTSINVGSLAKGMYLIEITTDANLKQVRKFIVN